MTKHWSSGLEYGQKKRGPQHDRKSFNGIWADKKFAAIYQDLTSSRDGVAGMVCWNFFGCRLTLCLILDNGRIKEGLRTHAVFTPYTIFPEIWSVQSSTWIPTNIFDVCYRIIFKTVITTTFLCKPGRDKLVWIQKLLTNHITDFNQLRLKLKNFSKYMVHFFLDTLRKFAFINCSFSCSIKAMTSKACHNSWPNDQLENTVRRCLDSVCVSNSAFSQAVLHVWVLDTDERVHATWSHAHIRIWETCGVKLHCCLHDSTYRGMSYGRRYVEEENMTARTTNDRQLVYISCNSLIFIMLKYVSLWYTESISSSIANDILVPSKRFGLSITSLRALVRSHTYWHLITELL